MSDIGILEYFKNHCTICGAWVTDEGKEKHICSSKVILPIDMFRLMFNEKYPENSFTEYISEQEVRPIRGIAEETGIRYPDADQLKILDTIDEILEKIK